MEPSTETIGVVLGTKREQQLAIDALRRCNDTTQQDINATVARERLEGLETVMRYGGGILLTGVETTQVINDLQARATTMPESRYSANMTCAQSAYIAGAEWLAGAVSRYRLRRMSGHMRDAYFTSCRINEAWSQVRRS